jgi:cytochrome c2
MSVQVQMSRVRTTENLMLLKLITSNGDDMNLSIVKLAILVIFLFGSFAQAESGKEIYEKKCAKCHGINGDGQGRSGRSLKSYEKDKEAMSFLNKEKMAKFTDDDLTKSIKNGGEAIGQSKDMEGFPGITDAEIKELIAYIKTMGK